MRIHNAYTGEACDWLLRFEKGRLADTTNVREAIGVAYAHGWRPSGLSTEERAASQVDAVRAAIGTVESAIRMVEEPIGTPRLVDQRPTDADIPTMERAARAWRASSPEERTAVREAFERVFVKLSAEDLADVAEFTGEITSAVWTSKAGHPLRIFATTEKAFTTKRAMARSLAALLDLYLVAPVPENAKAIDGWIAENQSTIAAARELAR